MARVGVLCYHGAGHLNPLIALSRELVTRGHHVIFYLPGELESHIRQQGLDFFPIDLAEIRQTDDGVESTSNSEKESTEDARVRLRRLDKEIGVYVREYLAAIEVTKIDALLMGEITFAGPTVAEISNTPYFVVSTSIPHNFGWQASEALRPHRTRQHRLQARIFEVSIFRMKGPVSHILDRHRHNAGLGPTADIEADFPELAHITQWPQCLDDVRNDAPERFFYTGPFIDRTTRPVVEFPWQELTEQPLVYASLGTTRKADLEIYHRVASACAGLDMQVVLTLGGSQRSLESLANFPRNTIVVANAPQLDLLERADVVITHAGPNTVLEALLFGKPMLALPLALDQPAVATRLERLGVAEVLSPHVCSADEIRKSLLKLQTDNRYRRAAIAIQGQLRALRGVARAASIVEDAMANYRETSLPKGSRPLSPFDYSADASPSNAKRA